MSRIFIKYNNEIKKLNLIDEIIHEISSIEKEVSFILFNFVYFIYLLILLYLSLDCYYFMD